MVWVGKHFILGATHTPNLPPILFTLSLLPSCDPVLPEQAVLRSTREIPGYHPGWDSQSKGITVTL